MGEEEIETCCYGLRVVGGWQVPKNFLLKILRLIPKALVNVQFIEIQRMETGEKHYYTFVGLGLGLSAGLPITGHLGNHYTVVCCNGVDCPTFDFFEGFGRLTLLTGGAVIGGGTAIFDFRYSGDCHLYYETFGVMIEVGAEIGTYVGYYTRLT